MKTRYSWLAGALMVRPRRMQSGRTWRWSTTRAERAGRNGRHPGAGPGLERARFSGASTARACSPPTSALQVTTSRRRPTPPRRPTTATVTVMLTDAPDETKTTHHHHQALEHGERHRRPQAPRWTSATTPGASPPSTASTSTDCYAVLGYIHARDRFFEMDFLRRAARGTLSELIGDLAAGPGHLLPDRLHRSGAGLLAGPGRAAGRPARRLPPGRPLRRAALRRLRGGHQQAHRRDAGRPHACSPRSTAGSSTPSTPPAPTDLPDWTDVDTVAIFRLQQFQLSANISGKLDSGLWAAAFGGRPDDATALRIRAWIRAKMTDPSYTLAGSGAPNAPSVLVAAPSPAAARPPPGHGPGSPAGQGPRPAAGEAPPHAR